MSYSNILLINKHKQNLATYIFSFIVVIAFYSFGTFGLLNLYGLRNSFQFLIILFTFFGLISITTNFKETDEYKNKNIFLITIVLFFLYYGSMFALIKGTVLTTLIQSLLMLIFTLYLMFVNIKYINMISKIIIIFTFILSLMGFIAYFAFIFNENLIKEVNFGLYDSTVGSTTIYAKSWVEYLSFTSGDGFEFFGYNVTRVKGFCNEPSATIVHYLAPAGLAFLFSKKYKFIGFFLLIFNFVGIASMMAWIAIFSSFIIYIILSIKNKFIKYFIIIFGVIVVLYIMSNVDSAVSLILDAGNSLYNTTSSSLVARKEGSATVRLLGFVNGINELKSHILGGSTYNTSTGLILNTTLVGGIFIFLVLSVFLFDSIKFSIKKFSNSNRKSVKFGVSLILSTLIVASILSNYGWDRIPGVIMLILYYRHLKEDTNYSLKIQQ